MIDHAVDVVLNKKVGPDTFLMGFISHQIASESGPGQFIMLRTGPDMDPLLRRPFSICGTKEGGLVYILYRVVGRGTAILSKKREGDALWAAGPIGRGFELPEGDKKMLLVAGGIGIAPLFYLAQAASGRDMEFMVGFPSSNKIIRIDEAGNPSVKISIATDDGSEGYAGMVTALLKKYLDQNPKSASYLFTCGPMQMLKSVISIAIDNDIPCQVAMETAMACGIGACLGCAVKASSPEGETRYLHVCKDGPVFPAGLIDWKSI